MEFIIDTQDGKLLVENARVYTLDELTSLDYQVLNSMAISLRVDNKLSEVVKILFRNNLIDYKDNDILNNPNLYPLLDCNSLNNILHKFSFSNPSWRTILGNTRMDNIRIILNLDNESITNIVDDCGDEVFDTNIISKIMGKHMELDIREDIDNLTLLTGVLTEENINNIFDSGDINNIKTLLRNNNPISKDILTNMLDNLFLQFSQNGDYEVVKLLLESGADVHALEDFSLRQSSRKGHLEVVKLLLEKGADVHALDDLSLITASNNGHTEVVRLLLENDANVHADVDEALRRSTYNGHTEVVRLLRSYM